MLKGCFSLQELSFLVLGAVCYEMSARVDHDIVCLCYLITDARHSSDSFINIRPTEL